MSSDEGSFDSNGQTDEENQEEDKVSVLSPIIEEIRDERFPEMDYYLNEKLSDVWFVVESVKIPANKTFLSVKSEVLRAQFSGHFADSVAKEIVIEETTVEAFKDMLRFLHKEDLQLSDDQSIELAKDVYILADRYKLLRLKDCLDTHFFKLINDKTLKDISSFAHEFEFESLSMKCKQYLRCNINDWLDKNLEELFAINAMTDNEMLGVIVRKHRETKNIIERICQRNDSQLLDRETGVQLFFWKRNTSLSNLFNFNEI